MSDSKDIDSKNTEQHKEKENEKEEIASNGVAEENKVDNRVNNEDNNNNNNNNSNNNDKKNKVVRGGRRRRNKDSSETQGIPRKNKHVERGETDAETYTAVARRQYQNRLKVFSPHGHKCAKCWLINECCACSKIAPVSTKHEYIMYMHHFEYLRGSNTGKILHMADPKTKMFICGQEGEEELFELLKKRDPNRVMVLMPKDSVSLEEFVENAFKDPKEAKMLVKVPLEPVEGLDFLESADVIENGASLEQDSTIQPQPSKTVSPSLPPISELPPVTVVVLDGTWKQVKGLLNRIPFVTRVHLPIAADGIKSLLTPVRQQSTPDRICTLQATIIAMQHLGEDPAVCESLIKSLKLFMNELLRQSGRKLKYDADDLTADLQEIVDMVNDPSYS